ncbi:MAG: DUF1351 domain-containing protein [Porphyromonadaceae bacterium]|nr:DUF1351 domain-containing protein [Porphyromonadaceae bacterium]
MEKSKIMVLESAPVINYKGVQAIGELVDRRLAELNFEGQVVTEDTVKSVKAMRASLNKEKTEYEERRKFIKQHVLAPYNEFEAQYKLHIADKYEKADNTLKLKIGTFETKIKDEKASKVRAYFNEYAQSKRIDFLKFEQANISVGLSNSEKSLLETAKAFIDNVATAIDTIDELPNDVEYKALAHSYYKESLNLSAALARAKATIEAKEAEAKRLAAIEQARQEAEARKAAEPKNEPLQAPIAERAEPKEAEQAQEAETSAKVEVYEMTFSVRGTIEQLKALKAFMIEREIEFSNTK